MVRLGVDPAGRRVAPVGRGGGVMNRSTWVATAILFGTLSAGLVGLGGETPPTAPQPRPRPDGPPPDKDITADVKDWNSNKYAAPPDKFRQGHTTPRPLDPKSITKTGTGFTVQLPSKAPIPTPTVHAGRVYVSGGFHSKEFYCFDAKTGELVWGVNLDDDGPSAAVCDGDIAIFNTESCTIFAVDAKTGKHLWSHWLGD